MKYRYSVFTLDGQGGQVLKFGDFRLTGVSIETGISMPWSMTASIEHVTPAYMDAWRRIDLREWSDCIWVFDETGNVVGGGIITNLSYDDSSVGITCTGFPAILDGMPWTGAEFARFDVEAGYLLRTIWAEAQQPGRNAGVKLIPNDFATKVLFGRRPVEEVTKKAIAPTGGLTDVVITAEQKPEPLTLNIQTTTDLGNEVNKVLSEAKVDYRERHRYIGAKPLSYDPNYVEHMFAHELVLGHPRLGARRHDLRFKIGENVATVPQIATDEDAYADEVVVLGSGESNAKLVSRTKRAQKLGYQPRFGRAIVKTYDDLTTQEAVFKKAQEWLEYSGRTNGLISSLEVLPSHANAVYGSVEDGDEIRLYGDAGQAGTIDVWLRVMGQSYNIDSGTWTLNVQKADTME